MFEIMLFLILFCGVVLLTYIEVEKEHSRKMAETLKAIIDYIKES